MDEGVGEVGDEASAARTRLSRRCAKGMPVMITARPARSAKSSPSLSLPRHTAKKIAPRASASDSSCAENSRMVEVKSTDSRGSTTGSLHLPMRSHTLVAFHASTHACITVYDGKNTSTPSGTMRAKLTMALPSSDLYSAVSRERNDELSVLPLGPTGTHPIQICLGLQQQVERRHQNRAHVSYKPRKIEHRRTS
jgi:hypothetical protein